MIILLWWIIFCWKNKKIKTLLFNLRPLNFFLPVPISFLFSANKIWNFVSTLIKSSKNTYVSILSVTKNQLIIRLGMMNFLVSSGNWSNVIMRRNSISNHFTNGYFPKFLYFIEWEGEKKKRKNEQFHYFPRCKVYSSKSCYFYLNKYWKTLFFDNELINFWNVEDKLIFFLLVLFLCIVQVFLNSFNNMFQKMIYFSKIIIILMCWEIENIDCLLYLLAKRLCGILYFTANFFSFIHLLINFLFIHSFIWSGNIFYWLIWWE